MNHRLLVSILGLSGLIAPAAYPQAAKTNSANSSSNYNQPRTPDGQPDLQGIWNSATITTLERPAELAGKAFFTPQEAVAYEKKFAVDANRDVRGSNGAVDVAGAYNQGWFDRGTKVVPSLRTSLVTNPPDGKIPYSAEGQKRLADAAEHTRAHYTDGPEELTLADRCILWRTAGPPMLPGPYNSNYQIFQTPGYVVIAVEMIHDVRFIPLDGRPHLPPNMKQWLGDSRGHWEGNTLVVDTTNFTEKPRFLGTTGKLHLTERFTRTSADAITYEFTVDDPTMFSKPWSASFPLNRSQGLIYEYACHEGNYAVPGILGGARKAERETSR